MNFLVLFSEGLIWGMFDLSIWVVCLSDLDVYMLKAMRTLQCTINDLIWYMLLVALEFADAV